jgi:predicted negative regulator of RcsB-dependent stress response
MLEFRRGTSDIEPAVAQEERTPDPQQSSGPSSEPRDRELDEAEQGLVSAGSNEAGSDEEPQNRRARRAAASQARKVRLKERKEAEAVGLDAQEMLDEAIARSSDKATKWLRRNSSILQGLVAVGVVGWAGFGLYSWRTAKVEQEASDALSRAIDASQGKIGDPAEQGKPNAQKVIDPTPIFADTSSRLKTAEDRFASAVKLREGSGTNAYAQLARASILLDGGKADEAKAAFEDLKRSKFAETDPEFRCQAIEGVALALEAKGDKQGALKSYQELGNTDVSGYKDLAQYHQARLQRDLGQLDAAKETLKKLQSKAKADPAAAMFGADPGYVQHGIQTLADELGLQSPETSGPDEPSLMAGPGSQISQEQLEALQKQLQEQLGKSGDAPAAPAGSK